MSRFAEALQQAGPSTAGRKCLTCAWFDEHPDERADVEEAYRQAPNRSHIWRVFKKAFDPEFSDAAFHNHFRRGHDTDR